MHILEHLNITVKLPIPIYIDNVGAMHMARNNTGGGGTQHVNHGCHFCREVCGTLIEFVFVKSENNDADLMTKIQPNRNMNAMHPSWFLKFLQIC